MSHTLSVTSAVMSQMLCSSALQLQCIGGNEALSLFAYNLKLATPDNSLITPTVRTMSTSSSSKRQTMLGVKDARKVTEDIVNQKIKKKVEKDNECRFKEIQNY